MMDRKVIVFALMTAALLFFIWGHSLSPINVSDGESRSLMGWIKPLLDPDGRLDDELFHHYLRKAAHFCEFAALGICMGGLFQNLPLKKSKRAVLFAFGACVLAAVVDECIQLFNPGRGPRISDVLLDSCGALLGIALMMLLFHMIHKRNKAAA